MDILVSVRRQLATGLLMFASVGAVSAQALTDPTRPFNAAQATSPDAGARAARPARPQLQSVLVSNRPGGRTVAVINGQTVRPGSLVDGASVVSITETAVVLRRGKALETLKLYPKAAPERAGQPVHATQSRQGENAQDN